MIKRFRVADKKKKSPPDTSGISVSQLIADAHLPVSIRAINTLPENPKLRLYRTLIPIQVLANFDINPRTWKNPDKEPQVSLVADAGTSSVKISAWNGENPQDHFFYIELADNAFNGIDLYFLIVNDPAAERYDIDIDARGRDTLFGTIHRNREAEEKAMRAGLAPCQVRQGLREIAQRLPRDGIGHFRKQAQMIGIAEQLLVERYGFFNSIQPD